ncbi:hypothetical protein LPTSP3_g27900 [Leptospira kobayashii]|uniref:DUF4105 domain-containing protein n=1 Tax=Leptospira kobayashii TaxID=1917830 RepID=A0ABM7ULJ9_9LEPT|nr:hypothetical protein [Leptospira kobayashii]BDA79860.1 hypothetical protein LPTSP3_g27900 [Leptospira kobayashii]
MTKEDLKIKWNGIYIIQRKWIENREERKKEALFVKKIREAENNTLEWEIPGLGYWKTNTPNESLPNEPENSFDSLITETETNPESDESKKYPETLSLSPPSRYISSISRWEDKKQKEFVRNFQKENRTPNLDQFIRLDFKKEFLLTDEEKTKLKLYSGNLKSELTYCLESDLCKGWEEILTLIRLQSIELSLSSGYFVIPKKTKKNLFYREITGLEIPKEVWAKKKEEAQELFQLTKNRFFSFYDPTSFQDWETIGGKVHSIYTENLEFTDMDTYPKAAAKIKITLTNASLTNDSNLLLTYQTRSNHYEKLVSGIYSYHLISKNCTNELFRYLNIFYPDPATRKERLGGTVSEKTNSLSFVPAIAYHQVKSNYKTKEPKQFLSYRLAKKREANLGFFSNIKEDVTFFSSTYKKNSFDPSFVFFTDDTIGLRPIYGLTNITWGIGNTGIGLFYLPWDKGKRLKQAAEGVFFSLPEIFFFNIRKGFFPYVTSEDLPKSYLQENLQTK